MNKISQMLGAQLEVTPFTGKYSLFGKLFAHYDFYGFVGSGLPELRGDQCVGAGLCRARANAADPDQCAVTGLKLGVELRRRHPQLHQPVPGAELRAARHHRAEQRRPGET